MTNLGVTNTREGCADLQKDLNRLERGAEKNHSAPLLILSYI